MRSKLVESYVATLGQFCSDMLIKADRDLSGGVIKIDVGVSKVPFDVHLELLCACSPYFESLFQQRFEQALSDEVLCFPDDDPPVFAQLILWMYRGNDSLEALKGKKMDFLVRLWILASKLEMAEFQNSVIMVCTAKTDDSPTGLMSHETVRYIYSHTLPQSPLRCLAVDIWMRKSTSERFDRWQEELPRPFLEALCRGFIKERENLKFPMTLSVLPEARYFTHLSPMTDRDGEVLPPRGSMEFSCAASDVQMKSRKIKIPCSRTQTKSVSSASIPVGNEAGIEEKSHTAEVSEKANIIAKTDLKSQSIRR